MTHPPGGTHQKPTETNYTRGFYLWSYTGWVVCMFGNFVSVFLDKKNKNNSSTEIRQKMLSFCNNEQKLVLNIDYFISIWSDSFILCFDFVTVSVYKQSTTTQHETSFQHRFSINVWAGIVGERLIGPHLPPNRLQGPSYLRFLRRHLPILLEDIPLNVRRQMWFMHNGTPAHFDRVVRDHLNERFHKRWIGHGGPVSWPPTSPDVTPLDFYL
jgi:hypothetical protein